MKINFLYLVLFLQSFAGFSQEKVKRSYLSASLFFPTPVGNYRSTNYSENENANYAKGSLGVAIEGAYMFLPNLGISAICGGYVSRFNSKAYKEDLNNSLDQDNPLKGHLEVKSNPHMVGALMIGPIFSVPFKRLSVDAKFNAGGVYYQLPTMEAYGNVNGNTASVILSASQVISLGYNPGVAARFLVSDRISLKLSIDYVYSKPELNARIVGKLNGKELLSSEQEAPSTISFVNIGFGLAFQLNKEK